MHRVINKQELSNGVYRFVVEAPLIASERKPGQFVMVQLDEDFGERIPLTIADADPGTGSITLIFQTVGKTTHELAEMDTGDSVKIIVGPLGTPTHIEKFGHVVCVGGGIGAAPLYPIAKGMKEAGNVLTVIVGARSREVIILEDEMRAIADQLVLCTDDGTYGRKGFVSDPLKELCEADPRPDLVVAIGPPIMMKVCANVTRPYGVHTVVSLNTIMVDGTGMCGGCRVTVGSETRFACVDGPEFDGHLVDFDNLILRLGAYKWYEDEAHTKCHLEIAARKKGGPE